MKLTKAYIALFVAIFLVFPGEAHMLRKDQNKLTKSGYSPIIEPPPQIYYTPEPTPIPIPYYSEPEPEPTQTSPTELTQLGPLQVSVTWDRRGDADLIVKTPSGKTINYSNSGPSEATDYGQLERDVQTGFGPETIYWDASHTAPAGIYYVCLRTLFNVDRSNPLTVEATVFASNGDTHSVTKTFTRSSNSLDCEPSAPHYIGSFTHRSRHEDTPTPVPYYTPEEPPMPEIPAPPTPTPTPTYMPMEPVPYYTPEEPPMPEYANGGSLEFSAIWDREGDGDLVVKTPNGRVINYSNSGPSVYTDFGALVYDVRSGLGPETITWGSVAPPHGTYEICFRTGAFQPTEENPVTATVTIVGPDGHPYSMSRTFTESASEMECDESSASYIGSYSYQQE